MTPAPVGLKRVRSLAAEPANTNRDACRASFAAHAVILRTAAEFRTDDVEHLRRYLRIYADLLDPRPGVVDFPAERTSEPRMDAQ